jgi:hypothetical protein
LRENRENERGRNIAPESSPEFAGWRVANERSELIIAGNSTVILGIRTRMLNAASANGNVRKLRSLRENEN